MSKSLEKEILRLLKQGNKELNINCFRCGVCCRYGCPMGTEEAEVISRHTGLSLSSFIENYDWFISRSDDIHSPDELENYRTLRNDGGCIFLEALPENHEVRCSIHTVRPPACQGYAPSLDREACRTGLKKMWGITLTPSLEIEGDEEYLKAFYDFLKSVVGDTVS